jgi:hypothetical protein
MTAKDTLYDHKAFTKNKNSLFNLSQTRSPQKIKYDETVKTGFSKMNKLPSLLDPTETDLKQIVTAAVFRSQQKGGRETWIDKLNKTRKTSVKRSPPGIDAINN